MSISENDMRSNEYKETILGLYVSREGTIQPGTQTCEAIFEFTEGQS